MQSRRLWCGKNQSYYLLLSLHALILARYSKLPFRLLARHYETDVTYTPMILAHEFIRSHIARDSDFSTCEHESRATSNGRKHALIAQFASSDPEEFARAADLISPWCDGVDINCGCPQSWAIKEGIGCSLQQSPELVAGMVKAAKARLSPSKSVSVKIRISKDLSETQRWINTVETAGADFITIHGRTRSQRSSTAPDYNAIETLVKTTKIPVLANGDAYYPEDLPRIISLTGAQGIMSARGILENPAVFAGHNVTPVECVQLFLGYAIRCPIPFPLVLHHLSEMTGRMEDMNKRERKRLLDCADLFDVVDLVEWKWGLGEKVAKGRLC